jgi:hypothetical protein
MRLPIDTTAIQFVSAGPADPVLDFETRTQRVDESGTPMFTVHLFGIAEGSHDTYNVKVAGEPKGIGNFTPVKVTGLMITTWEIGDKHGVSFKATAIEPSTKATA